MIDYIGCVSREDAEVLADLARSATRILEYGSGASTQIFRAYCNGSVTSVESEQEWIFKTLGNLERIVGNIDVRFVTYDYFKPSGMYDLVLIDNADKLRLPSAIAAWPHLAVGGIMAFHDTRRTKPHGGAKLSDVENVCRVVREFSTEIDSVLLNANDSNTTLIAKREPLLYVNWQESEGRTDAQMGL